MAGMVKRADFLENEVVDLTEEIKLVSPTDTPLVGSFVEYQRITQKSWGY